MGQGRGGGGHTSYMIICIYKFYFGAKHLELMFHVNSATLIKTDLIRD